MNPTTLNEDWEATKKRMNEVASSTSPDTRNVTALPHKPILCVDFDGVIHGYTSRWMGAKIIPDAPVPGALEWLEQMTNHFDVQIFSSRSHEPGGPTAMASWIVAHGVHAFGSPMRAIDLVNKLKFPTVKPPAFLTIDDRALTFEGSFDRFDAETLLQFQPWNRRKKDAPVDV